MFWKMEAEESSGTYPWTRFPWWELTFLIQAAAGKTNENLGVFLERLGCPQRWGLNREADAKGSPACRSCYLV